VLQCVAVYCSVLQCVAVKCSVLQCVAASRALESFSRDIELFDRYAYDSFHWKQPPTKICPNKKLRFHGTNSIRTHSPIWMCTVRYGKSEYAVLLDLAGVAFSVETVIRIFGGWMRRVTITQTRTYLFSYIQKGGHLHSCRRIGLVRIKNAGRAQKDKVLCP